MTKGVETVFCTYEPFFMNPPGWENIFPDRFFLTDTPIQEHPRPPSTVRRTAIPLMVSTTARSGHTSLHSPANSGESSGKLGGRKFGFRWHVRVIGFIESRPGMVLWKVRTNGEVGVRNHAVGTKGNHWGAWWGGSENHGYMQWLVLYCVLFKEIYAHRYK